MNVKGDFFILTLIFPIVKEEVEKCADVQEARETVIKHFDTVNISTLLNSSINSLKKD